MMVVFRPVRGSPGLARDVVRAIESASHSAGGNGITFPTGLRSLGSRPRGFPIAEEELILTLPGPLCPAAGGRGDSSVPVAVLAFGRTSAGEIIGPELEPRQGRHVAVVGETGMGKSSLLVALARRASRGAGVVLLDPLGETAEALDRELDPSVRSRTLRIDPIQAPVRVNALDGIDPKGADPVRSERRLNDLVHAMRRVRAGRYADSGFWGPRLEEMLTRAVRAAASLPEGTLVDAHTLLATGARVPRDVPSQAMGPMRELADRIRERPEDAEGARRLVYEVVRSGVLEAMLCARTPELATRELVAPGRVVLVSGNAARVGESTARYLLSVYLALLWSELLARPEASKTFVVLDEAQWFSHESLSEMLRLGRRANVHVVLATQAIASLPDTVSEAVWTNVSDFVAFRGSPEEARELSRAVRGISAEAILSLPRGHAAVLLGKGNSVRWLRTVRIPNQDAPEPPGGVVSAGSASDPPPIAKGAPRSPDRSPPVISSSYAPAAGSVPRRAPTSQEVLHQLAARAREREEAGPWRVPLETLRRDLDPGGQAVREVGAILGRAGAILATERTEQGTVWVLDPARLSAVSDGKYPGPGADS
jgi:Helicase HerA, central domain/TraM recognition site of TraD and TraG